MMSPEPEKEEPYCKPVIKPAGEPIGKEDHGEEPKPASKTEEEKPRVSEEQIDSSTKKKKKKKSKAPKKPESPKDMGLTGPQTASVSTKKPETSKDTSTKKPETPDSDESSSDSKTKHGKDKGSLIKRILLEYGLGSSFPPIDEDYVHVSHHDMKKMDPDW